MTTKPTLSNIPCSSCDSIRYQLKRKKSKLLPSFTLNLCSDCIEKKYEPRWIVIMAARRYGADKVSNYLEPKRYVGEDILLKEIG